MKSEARVVIFAMSLCVFTGACSGAVSRIKTERKVVALTFDDGPNPPYTEALLKVLEEEKVKATFFLIGQQVDAHPETAKQILRAGHDVGGHSNDWKSLAFKSRKTVERQLDAMDRAFAGVGVTNLTLFRPPNGILSPGQGKILEGRGLIHISADVVAGDWKPVSAETIRDRVVKKVRPGSIVVLHDGGGNRAATIEAVGGIISQLKEQEYSFLSVSDLLKLQ